MRNGRSTVAVVLCALMLSGCAADAVAPPGQEPGRTSTPTDAPSESPTTEPATSEPPSSPSEPATSEPPPTTTPPPPPPPKATDDGLLESGENGPAVLALQERLAGLGYWLGGPDGEYGHLTQQAVMALQGVAGLSRDGVAGPDTLAALEAGVRPTARSGGNAVEIDLDAQVMTIVIDGSPSLVLHTSTGTDEKYTPDDGITRVADTPRGDWEIAWARDEWRTSFLGRLYRPRYFHPNGIAVHGAHSVPGYPASHGCARVSIAAMDMIWRDDLMPIGRTVLVF